MVADGPHCFGGALEEVRPWVANSGFRRRVDVSFVPASFPSTLVARSWIADHEFPHNPDSVVEVSRLALEACVLAERINEDAGAEVNLERDGLALGAGDADLEPDGVACSLPEFGYSSSPTEIRRRVRGRRVEGEPLAGFMAFGSRADLATEEQHRTGGRSDRKMACSSYAVIV
jgi:hypothetical protein